MLLLPAAGLHLTNARRCSRVCGPASQGLALASMIAGIIGLVAGGCLGPIPGIIAVILGIMALSQIKKSPAEFSGKPFATAGIILGAIIIAFYVILLIWFLLALAFG